MKPQQLLAVRNIHLKTLIPYSEVKAYHNIHIGHGRIFRYVETQKVQC